jgi:hypothetical protein
MADQYLGKKRDRPLPGRATRLQRREDGFIAVRYQRTDVVTYREDGSIVLNSDGYHTLTTRQRINEYAPIKTWSERGVMFIGQGYPWRQPGSPYVDGIVISADGSLILPERAKEELTTREEISRRIRKYAALVRSAVERGEMSTPELGDCLLCQIELSRRMERARVDVGSSFPALAAATYTANDELVSADHYLSHLEEGYVMGSLLANAILARNYGNPAVVFSMINHDKNGKWASQIVRWYLRSLLPKLAK